jgi:hypothetical protein
MLEKLQKINPANEAKMDDTGSQSAGNNFAWLAAIINGEGSVGLEKIWSVPPKRQRRRYFSPRISICNTDPAIIVRCAEIYKSMNVPYYIMDYDRKENRTIFTIRVDKMRDIKTVLIAINPFMVGEKKARGQLLLEYVESRLQRINTPNPKWETIRPSQRHKTTNPPYNDRELEIAENFQNWNLNDHTSPAEVLRRYGLNSDRKTESVAEMTTSTA